MGQRSYTDLLKKKNNRLQNKLSRASVSDCGRIRLCADSRRTPTSFVFVFAVLCAMLCYQQIQLM